MQKKSFCPSWSCLRWPCIVAATVVSDIIRSNYRMSCRAISKYKDCYMFLDILISQKLVAFVNIKDYDHFDKTLSASRCKRKLQDKWRKMETSRYKIVSLKNEKLISNVTLNEYAAINTKLAYCTLSPFRIKADRIFDGLNITLYGETPCLPYFANHSFRKKTLKIWNCFVQNFVYGHFQLPHYEIHSVFINVMCKVLKDLNLN